MPYLYLKIKTLLAIIPTISVHQHPTHYAKTEVKGSGVAMYINIVCF